MEATQTLTTVTEIVLDEEEIEAAVREKILAKFPSLFSIQNKTMDVEFGTVGGGCSISATVTVRHSQRSERVMP